MTGGSHIVLLQNGYYYTYGFQYNKELLPIKPEEMWPFSSPVHTRGEAIMLVKLSIILFSISHNFTYVLCSQILPIILKIMLGLMFMAFQTANNTLLIK